MNHYHIKMFEEFRNEQVNEGVKDWIIGGLMALSSFGSVSGQDLDKSTVKSPTTRTEYQIHQDQLDSKSIDSFLKYHKKIVDQSNGLNFSQDGKYTMIKGSGFFASISKGGTYNKYSCFIGFGNEEKPDAQISITLKDDGVISLIYGEERLKGDQTIDFGGVQRTRKAGTQLMNQTELEEGDKGYDECMQILDLFNKG